MSRSGEKQLVLSNRTDHLKTDRLPVRGRRTWNAQRRAARHVGEGGKHRVPARPRGTTCNDRRKRLVRRPGERRNGWGQDEIIAGEEKAELLPQLHHDLERRIIV